MTNSTTNAASNDHAFVPQSFGSVYCGECRQRFDAPQHGFISQWDQPPRGSIASDILENMERDYLDDQQLRAEEFNDDYD